MPAFKEMDPEVIRQLLQGHEDVLTSEVKKEETFFAHSTCPVCGGSKFSTHVNSTRPFTEGALLPNKLLYCMSCNTEFDPYTRFVTRTNFESA